MTTQPALAPDRLRRVWNDGGTALGIFLFTRLDSVAVEALAKIDYDFVCIDLQHGMMSYDDMVATFALLGLGNATPIVRVPANDAASIGRVLDAGAIGVIVPMVNSADDAQRAVAACRYAPAGVRSYGPIRARIAYGNDYVDTANDRVICIPQIETAEAVDNADAILAVPGVGAVYVGPTDLSLSYGLPPTLDNPEPFPSLLARIAVAAKRHGVVPAVHASTALAAARHAAGFRMITIANDLALIVNGFTTELRDARANIAG